MYNDTFIVPNEETDNSRLIQVKVGSKNNVLEDELNNDIGGMYD